MIISDAHIFTLGFARFVAAWPALGRASSNELSAQCTRGGTSMCCSISITLSEDCFLGLLQRMK